jgi:hypothetical protein
VHDEEDNVGPLHRELTDVLGHIGQPYELVFVNDGSRDRTLSTLEALAARDPYLRIVDLDGNFGEAAALSAGFSTARGDVVVTLDGDGQNDPHDIPKLIAKLDEGYDAVSGRRVAREEAFAARVLPSWLANRLIALCTGVPVYDCGCGLKAYRRELVAGIQLPRGMHRFLPAILGTDPARVAEVETRDRPRASGTSHYGLSRAAIVLRDVLALPLLVRRPAPGQGAAVALATAAIALDAMALAGWRTSPGSAIVLGLAGAATLAVRYNVSRFADARVEGVFRVRRIIHGSAATGHRHRGSRVLGQESAAHLPPPARRPGERSVRSRP